MKQRMLVDIELVQAIAWGQGCGDRLRESRRSRGFTSRKKLSDHLKEQGIKVSEPTVQGLETGKRGWVKLATLRGICEGIGCELSEILPCLIVCDRPWHV